MLGNKILDSIKVVDLLEPDAYAAAGNVGAIIDRQGYDSIVLAIYMGAGVGTKTNIATLGDDTAVGMGTEALFATLGTLTSAGHDDAVHLAEVNLEGANRYIRLTATNNDTLDFAAFGILGKLNALAADPAQEQTELAITYA